MLQMASFIKKNTPFLVVAKGLFTFLVATRGLAKKPGCLFWLHVPSTNQDLRPLPIYNVKFNQIFYNIK